MAKAYSYTRWSSSKQSTGSSLDRQLAYARNIAQEHGLELVEILDAGVSAYRGKNAVNGALGGFLKAVEDGTVSTDSWLIVENLDRLSRQAILESQSLFSGLLAAGITVVTGMDNKIYSKETVTENPMELMYSIMLFSRAHEESRTKSKRTNTSALRKIKAHQDGVRSSDGYAIAIQEVGAHPFFVDCSDGTVKPHKVYFPIAKEIIRKQIEGWGTNRIKKWLDANYQPPQQRKVKHLPTWNHDVVRRFPFNDNIRGVRKVTLEGVEHVLYDYYPPVVDESTFYKLKHVRVKRRTNSTSQHYVGLITGIGIARCGHCGSSLCVFRASRKDRKVKETLRYACVGKQKGEQCIQRTYSHHLIEDTLLRVGLLKVWKPKDHVLVDTSELDAMQAKLEDLKSHESNLLENLTLFSPAPSSMVKKMQELQVDIADTIEKIERLELGLAEKRAAHPIGNIEKMFRDIPSSVLDIKNDTDRIRVRELLRDSIEQVSLEALEGGQRAGFRLTLNWKDGSQDVVERKRGELSLNRVQHAFGERDYPISTEESLDIMTNWNWEFGSHEISTFSEKRPDGWMKVVI